MESPILIKHLLRCALYIKEVLFYKIYLRYVYLYTIVKVHLATVTTKIPIIEFYALMHEKHLIDIRLTGDNIIVISPKRQTHALKAQIQS